MFVFGYNASLTNRKLVFLPLDNHVIMFKEEGIWNYSTMLIREDLGLLVLGAREAVYALDINDISDAKSKVPVRFPFLYLLATKRQNSSPCFKTTHLYSLY